MQTILAILLILAMLATLFALVRGIVQFLKTSRTKGATRPCCFLNCAIEWLAAPPRAP